MTAQLGRYGEHDVPGCLLIDAMLWHRRSDRCDRNARPGAERRIRHGVVVNRAIVHHRDPASSAIACTSAVIACSSGESAEQSFGLQSELDRRGRNLARRCRVVFEDIERLAERCCRDLSLAKHDARAHEASPTLDVSR